MTKHSSSNPLVTFWGTRGSVPTPGSTTEKYGGNTPCVSVQYGNTEIILDAGTGIRSLGIALMARKKQGGESRYTPRSNTLHLLLSHTHWDHIQGLPFFEPAYAEGTRLSIYGSPRKGRFLESILEGQMDVNYFPVDMNAFSAEITINEISADKVKIGNVQVTNEEQIRHPGGSLRYCLECGRKRIVYATDVELDTIFDNKSRTKQNRTLAKKYRDFITDADLLIADGQYTTEQYLKRKGLKWGHTSIPLLLKIAHEQGVKQVAVFHHDPQNSDSILDALWAKYAPQYSSKTSPMNIFWSREGMTLAV